MSIQFDPARKTLTLNTRNTTYQMLVTATGHLLHLYYGRRAEGCFDYLLYPRDCGFSPNPYEKRSDRSYSLNSWEAAYFDFDEEKLLDLARGAKELGVDMVVLDDGWFGNRDDDNRGLGDWFENKRKLPGGLEGLIGKVNELGLQFGLWIEPEMVSEDSELYRAHPDWAILVHGLPCLRRPQSPDRTEHPTRHPRHRCNGRGLRLRAGPGFAVSGGKRGNTETDRALSFL